MLHRYWVILILSLGICGQCMSATKLKDEGVNQGYFNELDIVGSGITATRSGIEGTLTVDGTFTGLLQGDTLSDGTLSITGGELTTTGDIYVGSFRSPWDSAAHVQFDASGVANLDINAAGGICLHGGTVGVYFSSFTRFGDVLLSNTDLVFECDGDNNGSNKFSWTDGASAEVMSLDEGGNLFTTGEITVSDVITTGTEVGTALFIGSDGVLCLSGQCN